MWFWSILALASLAFSSPIRQRATDEVDVLSSTALRNKIAYNSQHGMNKTCTAKNAVVRREWSDLQPSERKQYTDAVVCLMNKPAKLTAPDAPGIRSRYDDFVSVHMRQTMTIHDTGNFLTWHRLYIWAFEKALREECGYPGYLPYWAWEKYVDNLLDSPLFDGSEYSMSGNGKYVPNNGTIIVIDDPATATHLPGGQGGGCVTSGPFKNMTVNLGPIKAAYVSEGIEPQKDKNGLGYNPRCLRRDVTVSTIKNSNTVQDVMTLIQNSNDVGTFQGIMQGTVPVRGQGVHGGGHFSIGGDPASDVFVSPGDPVFFLHHGMIDRVFWIWQNLEPERRRHVVAGTITLGNNPPSINATLEDIVDMGGLGENRKLDDLLDSTLGDLCYVYT